MSPTAGETPCMSDFVVGPNRAIWDVLLQTRMKMRVTDDWQHMVDSTVSGPIHRPQTQKGARTEAFGRSRGDLREKSMPDTTIRGVLLAL